MKPRMIEPKLRYLIDTPLQVGESPVWDDRTGNVWFVDITAPAIFRLAPSGKLDHFPMPAPTGCLGLCESGMIVVGLKTGVHIFDPATAKLELLCDPDQGRADSRLNDGKVGPDGHFWVGTRDEAVPPTGNARLYRVSANGDTQTTIEGGLLTSNGLAWSPDAKRMYHSDSSGLFFQAFDFDATTGEIGPAIRLHDFAPDEGRPDGAAIDIDGCYWSAGVQAGRLNRFTPDGELFEVYTLPFKGPTMPCFGGSDLKKIYLTSLVTQPNGIVTHGTLVAFDAPVEGTAAYRFSL